MRRRHPSIVTGALTSPRFSERVRRCDGGRNKVWTRYLGCGTLPFLLWDVDEVSVEFLWSAYGYGHGSELRESRDMAVRVLAVRYHGGQKIRVMLYAMRYAREGGVGAEVGVGLSWVPYVEHRTYHRT